MMAMSRMASVRLRQLTLDVAAKARPKAGDCAADIQFLRGTHLGQVSRTVAVAGRRSHSAKGLAGNGVEASGRGKEGTVGADKTVSHTGSVEGEGRGPFCVEEDEAAGTFAAAGEKINGVLGGAL